MNAIRMPRRCGRFRAKREAWPRVGATLEGGRIVVRLLVDGEQPHPMLRRAVLLAEPCAKFRTVAAAAHQAALTLADRLRKRGAVLPVEVRT